MAAGAASGGAAGGMKELANGSRQQRIEIDETAEVRNRCRSDEGPSSFLSNRQVVCAGEGCGEWRDEQWSAVGLSTGERTSDGTAAVRFFLIHHSYEAHRVGGPSRWFCAAATARLASTTAGYPGARLRRGRSVTLG